MMALAVVALGSILLGGTASPALVLQDQETRLAVVSVDGLACPFCVYGLEKHLRKLPEADDVRVDLGEGEVTVEFSAETTVTDEQIKNAVRDAGFTARTIVWKTAESPSGDGSS